MFHEREYLTTSVFSMPTVRNLDDASTARCFRLARWATSKSSSNSCERHRSSVTDAFDGSNMLFSELWLVFNLDRVHSRYGRRATTTHAMRGRFRWVVSFTSPVLVRKQNQYSIGVVILSDFSSRNIHPTWTSRASIFSVCWRWAWSNAKSGGQITFFWRLVIASRSFCFNLELNGQSSRDVTSSSNGTFTQLYTTPPETLKWLRNDFPLVKFHESVNPFIASDVCSAIFIRLEGLPWPKFSMFFVIPLQFSSLRVTLAFPKNVYTCLAWWKCSAAEREKATVSSWWTNEKRPFDSW